MNNILSRLSFNTNISNSNLLILLTLLNCAFLVDVSVGDWIIMPPSIIVMFVLVSILFVSYRYWWASFLGVCLFLLMLGPDFPRLANHGNLAIFTCLIMVILFLRKIITKKGIHTDTITLSFRYTLVTIYFIAGFHKLNSGFFSLHGSCSTYVSHYFSSVVFDDNFTPSHFALRTIQIATIVIEMIIPFGILFSKTRKATAIILVVFHFYLSFCGFSNFSAFAAFLITGCILDLDKLKVSSRLENALRFYVLAAIVAALAAYLLRRFGIGTRQSMLAWNGIIFNAGWVYYFYILLKINVKSKKFKLSYAPFVFVVLLVLWGVQGYVGLSNTATLTMFSNLVTEQKRSNHFIINTTVTKLWNYEEDYVTILRLPLDSDWGKYYSINNYDLPVVEFKKVAAYWVKNQKQKLSCVIKHDNKIIYIDDLAASGYSSPLWWHTFLYYRRIPKEGINQCQW